VDIPEINWKQRSDWINVTEHGAIGNGVADDTAAIQALLDNVESGSTFYFPPGTYRITKMLTMTGPCLGTSWIGHGKTTIISWDGEENGKMFREDGFAQNARYEGFVFNGNKKASIGIWHTSNTRFETEVLHRNLAFIGFRNAAIHLEINYKNKGDKYATAETVYQNCLFEDCGTGVFSTSFNDYNHTYEGCEFRRCGTGITCSQGNFYVRNTHFEGSLIADIKEHGEHGCSVRRTTSYGSKTFIIHTSTVAPLIVQDCHVEAWTNSDQKSGAAFPKKSPELIFDCTFKAPPFPDRPPVPTRSKIIAVNNTKDGDGILYGYYHGPSKQDKIYAEKHVKDPNILPDNKTWQTRLNAKTSFLKSNWTVPNKIFDAKVDFGAKGDGKTDDTLAIQKCIDSARAYGENSIAYLPIGKYVITNTLTVTGTNYTVGGCGPRSQIIWKGKEGGTTLSVHNPQMLHLENIMIGHHDSGKSSSAIDIMHTETEKSYMTYEAVFVFGMYQRAPFKKGFHFKDLYPDSLVILNRVNGNLRFTDCAQATIFAPVSYEGSLTVEGKNENRQGFLGFQTRLTTIAQGVLYIRDNQNLVASELYAEQTDSGYHIQGDSKLPEGRITIQAPKLHLSERIKTHGPVIDVDNYKGEILLGPMQFPCYPHPAAIRVTGESNTTLTLIGSKFYETMPDWILGPNVKMIRLGIKNYGPYDKINKKLDRITLVNPQSSVEDNATKEDLKILMHGINDLRRLGDLDLKINYPNLKIQKQNNVTNTKQQ
jgi:hypothetical protein